MRRAHAAEMAILLTLALMGEAWAKPLPRLTVSADGLPPSFRDASLEGRCEALIAYLDAFRTQHLKPLILEFVGCAEGNGLGGARYALDFQIGKSENKLSSYRLDVAYQPNGKATIDLCDTNATPIACTTKGPREPLTFPYGTGRFETKEEAALAVSRYRQLHANMDALLPTLADWIERKPKAVKIYGEDYATFVQKILAYDGAFPFLKAERVKAIKFRLIPTDKKRPHEGRVEFTGSVDADFVKCFNCDSVKCLNEQVHYKFEDRFFSLTRVIPKKEGKGEKIDHGYGAGWIIDGPLPMEDDKDVWKPVCGVSRYSLQKY